LVGVLQKQNFPQVARWALEGHVSSRDFLPEPTFCQSPGDAVGGSVRAMGFFSKLKKSFGKTGVELKYTWIEDPLTFTDPMVKATVTVSATDGAVTVLGTSAKLVARRKNGEEQEEITLGEVSEEADPHCTTTRNGESVPVFPHVIQTGESEGFGIFLDDLDLATSLADWGVSDAASARAKGVEIDFVTEVDIKETNFMFDPNVKQTIGLN